jgi:VanZ family protein
MLLRADTRRWQAIFWFVWLVCTVLFLLPATELPDIKVWDKAQHAIAFFVLMLLVLPAHRRHVSIITLACLLCLYGVLVEVGQWFVPNRSFSVLDMVADSVGVALAAVANRWIQAEQWNTS